MMRLLITFYCSGKCRAYKPSDSYLILKIDGAKVQGRIGHDLDFAIGLDGNGDGELAWGELRSRHDAIAAYAPRLKIYRQKAYLVPRAPPSIWSTTQ